MLKYSESELDERKFVDNAIEYLGRFWGEALGREYTPEEWKTGRQGKPRALDIIRYGQDKKLDTAIEVKFVRRQQDFPNQIVDDVFRLLSLQDVRERYLLVGGCKPEYQKIWENEMLNSLLPLDHDKRFGTDRKHMDWASLWKKALYHDLGWINVDIKGLPSDLIERTKQQAVNCKTFEVRLKAFFCPRGDWGIDTEKHEGIPFIDVRLWKLTPL
jgi:hypothetical protein